MLRQLNAPEQQAEALGIQGLLHFCRDEFGPAAACLEEGLANKRATGTEWEVAV